MNLDSLYTVVVLAFAVSAVSMTITKAKIFASPREWVMSRSNWLGTLISCPYCTSHWIAFAAVIAYKPILIAWIPVVDLLVSTFVVVALAALISGFIFRAFRGMEK